jgi:deaminated glutathione amidase
LIVAAAQMCSGISPEQNLDIIEELAAEAKTKGAHYLLTPEMSVAFCENPAQLNRIALPFEGNWALARCAQIARDNDMFLHIGSLAIALDAQKFANRSVLFAPNGSVVDYYDKIHLFDAQLPGETAYRESATYRAGERAVAADMGKIKLGMSICYDLRFAPLYALLAQAGAQVLTVPAAFTVPTGKAHWQVLLRARAIETGCFVIAAAQGGTHENGRSTYGHSMIISPWGEVMALSDGQSSGIITTELDVAKVTIARQKIPALANRRPFSLSVNHSGLE